MSDGSQDARLPAWFRVARTAPAIALGCVAFALVLIITDPPGPGLDPDALAYMGAAESVAAHGTYTIPSAKWASQDSIAPLAHFPPGYPTALALPVRLGMAPPQAARLVQATAAFVTIATLVLLLTIITSELPAILLAVALFATTWMHEVHVSVLSEPLFLACLALALAAMVLAPDRPLRSGIPAALGVMTRYAGASLVAAAMLWQLLGAGSWRERIRRALVAGFPALLLDVIWIARTRATAGAREIRTLALYGNLGPTIRQGGETLCNWLVPDGGELDPVPHRAAIAVAAAMVVCTLAARGAWHARRTHRAAAPDRGRSFYPAALLLLACYLGMILTSRLIADPDIPFDNRILAPALLLATTITAVGLAEWWHSTTIVLARIAVGGALGGWWLASASATVADARYSLAWGSDFAGQQWRESELLGWARHDGARAPLYSNWPAAVYFYLHRPARELPLQKDPPALSAFADTVRNRGALVLMFDVHTGEYVPVEALLGTPGLHVVARLGDGVVLGAR